MSRVLRLSPVPPPTDVAVETRPSMAHELLESYVRGRRQLRNSRRRRSVPGVASASLAFALAMAMLGTTLPIPLYSLYREHVKFAELLEGRS
jgi:hypothetical protein